MNLLLFRINFERDLAVGELSRYTNRVTSDPRGGLTWIAAIGAALGCVVLVAACGWFLLSTSAATSMLPGWLESWVFPTPVAGDARFRVDVLSTPTGARVQIDGRERGRTPTTLLVSAGTHELALKHADAVDERRDIEEVVGDRVIDVDLWLRRPNAVQLRAAYPGSTIRDVAFLADGRLAMTMSRPESSAVTDGNAPVDAWIFDPGDGLLTPLPLPAGFAARFLAVSPDGRRVAYGVRSSGQHAAARGLHAAGMVDEVWVHGEESDVPTRVFPLSDPVPSSQSAVAERETVHDVAWTPDGVRLLITTHAVASGGVTPASRSRLLRVDATPGTRVEGALELLVLPAEVVRSSYNWAPDGRWVAFLTRVRLPTGGAPFVALCALDTSGEGGVAGFRYVSDLARETAATTVIAPAPVAWSPVSDGRLAYSALVPRVSASNVLGLPVSGGGESRLFLTTPTPGLGTEGARPSASAPGLFAPAWFAGAGPGGPGLLALTRSDGAGKPLVVQGVEVDSGKAREIGLELPTGVARSAAFTARWDLEHGRLLVVSRPPDGSPTAPLEYWLIRLRAKA